MEGFQEAVFEQLRNVRRVGLALLDNPKHLNLPTDLLETAAKSVPGYNPGLTRTAAITLLLKYEISQVTDAAHSDWLIIIFGLAPEYKGKSPSELRIKAKTAADVTIGTWKRPKGREEQVLHSLAAQIIADCFHTDAAITNTDQVADRSRGSEPTATAALEVTDQFWEELSLIMATRARISTLEQCPTLLSMLPTSVVQPGDSLLDKAKRLQGILQSVVNGAFELRRRDLHHIDAGSVLAYGVLAGYITLLPYSKMYVLPAQTNPDADRQPPIVQGNKRYELAAKWMAPSTPDELPFLDRLPEIRTSFGNAFLTYIADEDGMSGVTSSSSLLNSLPTLWRKPPSNLFIFGVFQTSPTA